MRASTATGGGAVEPRRPRGPRRGPHPSGAHALPDCPPGGRMRVVSPPAMARASRERDSAPSAQPS